MPTHHELSDIAIRRATTGDRDAVERLAALDSAKAPRGEVLLGVVAGEPWAALGVDDRHVVADPFRPSGQVVALLQARAQHVSARGPASRPSRAPAWRRALRLA
jgi:hypothetical protein